MKLGKTLYVTNRKSWRSWLAKNYDKEDEIWLVYYRKDSGKPRISYNDSVEEALCYGWIDSIVKSLDKERFAQRFTPRKKGSNLSQPNIERVRKLIKEKKMTDSGLSAIAHAFNPAKDFSHLIIPPYILKALKANSETWEHFQKFPESYKRVRITYIESQKRHGKEQHQRALRHFINMTAKNTRFGFVKE